MNIQSLLNSPSGGGEDRHTTASPRPLSPPPHLAPRVFPKKQKLAKDAPIFCEGTKIVGHINYPPHEAGNDHELEARHREFRVFPLGQIHKQGVRHIPYASDKKDFLNKTGRDAFEVFQYTYKRPGEDREFVVVWDYNVGLVRMTPFFKSCRYSKIVPAKALNQNPGLKAISYSITGGALVCQGYWIPWQAARNIAATFCWDIRWALTPVFGNDFPEICRPPHHHAFGKFVIDPEIVSFCVTETARFKREGASYQLLSKTPSPVAAPPIPVMTPPTWGRDARPGDLESGYGSDLDRNAKCGFSPLVSPRSQHNWCQFTPINGADLPTSLNRPYFSALPPSVAQYAMKPLLLQASIPGGHYGEVLRTKRTHSKVAYSDSDCDVAVVNTSQAEMPDAVHDEYEHLSYSPRTLEAAEVLMSLTVVARNAAALPTHKRTRRGSRAPSS